MESTQIPCFTGHIHSLSQYLLSTYYVPDSVTDAGGSAVGKTAWVSPALTEGTF